MSVIPDDFHERQKLMKGELMIEHQHLTTELTFFRGDFLIFNVLRFTKLSKIGEIVLVILYRNAKWEHLFSIVQKNKTDTWSSKGYGYKESYTASHAPFYQWKSEEKKIAKEKCYAT